MAYPSDVPRSLLFARKQLALSPAPRQFRAVVVAQRHGAPVLRHSREGSCEGTLWPQKRLRRLHGGSRSVSGGLGLRRSEQRPRTRLSSAWHRTRPDAGEIPLVEGLNRAILQNFEHGSLPRHSGHIV